MRGPGVQREGSYVCYKPTKDLNTTTGTLSCCQQTKFLTLLLILLLFLIYFFIPRIITPTHCCWFFQTRLKAWKNHPKHPPKRQPLHSSTPAPCAFPGSSVRIRSPVKSKVKARPATPFAPRDGFLREREGSFKHVLRFVCFHVFSHVLHFSMCACIFP